jgi:Dolichyl-phosphate-mannose-protein mannosyltransferase
LCRRHWLALGIILAAGAVLRVAYIGTPSLWMDEIGSIQVATGHGLAHDQLPIGIIEHEQINLTQLSGAPPWWKIWTAGSDNVNPPLYYILLRWWLDLFGTGAAAVRMLSAIFSLAAVVVFFDVCRWLHGPRIALLAGALMALVGAQLDFAQDARAYAMLIFLGLCCCDAVVRIERAGATPRRLGALALAVAAMGLTHYFSLGAALALGVYVLIRLRGPQRRRVMGALAAAGGFCLVVWAPQYLKHLQHLPTLSPAFLQEARVAHHGELTLRRIIGLPAEFIFGESRGEAILPRAALILALLTLALPPLRLWWRRDLLLWVLWIVGIIGSIAALDLARGLTLVGYPRYTILASPAVYAVLAAFDWPRRAILRDVLPLAILALLMVLAGQRLKDGVSAREDWRKLADLVQSQAQPDELLVFFNQDPWVPPGVFYRGFQYYAPKSNHPWMMLNHPADLTVLRQLDSQGTLWLIGKFNSADGPIVLPGWRNLMATQTDAWTLCHMRLVVPSARLVSSTRSTPP